MSLLHFLYLPRFLSFVFVFLFFLSFLFTFLVQFMRFLYSFVWLQLPFRLKTFILLLTVFFRAVPNHFSLFQGFYYFYFV